MSRYRVLTPTTLLCAMLTSLLAMAAPGDSVAIGSTWLDAKPLPAWNTSGAPLPKAPRGDGQSLKTGRCAELARKPTSASDRALMKAGWTLLGPLQVFDTTEVITAAAEGDGQCRAMGFQVFVFVDGRFAGTLSPEPMTDRFDGVMGEVRLSSPKSLTATVRRYGKDDPLCCPSRLGTVEYTLQPGPRGPVVTATQATTSPTPAQ